MITYVARRRKKRRGRGGGAGGREEGVLQYDFQPQLYTRAKMFLLVSIFEKNGYMYIEKKNGLNKR